MRLASFLARFCFASFSLFGAISAPQIAHAEASAESLQFFSEDAFIVRSGGQSLAVDMATTEPIRPKKKKKLSLKDCCIKHNCKHENEGDILGDTCSDEGENCDFDAFTECWKGTETSLGQIGSSEAMQ